MLLRFRFSNFRSFRAEQELSLIAGSSKETPEAVFHPPGLREGVLPVAALYGANASGKTNVIRALQFMATAVVSSHQGWQPDGPIPREPFAMDEESREAPSEFEVDFLSDGIRHQYGFALDSNVVLREWLYVYPSGKKQTWFSRATGKPTSFGSKMPGENRMIESLTRKNSLFLSAAAQNNHEALLPVYTWFRRSLSFVVGDRDVWKSRTANLCTKEDYRNAVARLVSAADLGIADLQVEEPPLLKTRAEMKLLHRVGTRTVPFEINQESDGTIAYLALLGPIMQALDDGRTVCADELDSSLHPLLAIEIIRLFNGPTHNPRGAQLIFNTHDTNLLSSRVLRRDQIWFTEKKDDASTHLYPLSDFRPRRHENLENGYLQGRYGAIPFVNSDAFLSSFGVEDEKA
jgi:hypothetical protein